MRKIKYALFITLIMCSILLFAGVAFAEEDFSGYIVNFRDDFDLEASQGNTASLMSEVNTDTPLVSEIYEEKNLFKIDDRETLEYYASIGAIESYEPDYYAELMYIPKDTYYNTTYQKNLWNINVQSAWNLGCYGNDVKIGIIDSGIYNHNDLQDAFVGGKNYVNAEISENAENADNYYDTLGHGTFVAGVIGAQFNGYLTAGIAPKAKLYSLKCTTSGENIQYSDIIKCIYGAVDDFGCDVINMSLGGTVSSDNLLIACLYARSKGAILCAAVGNYGNDGNPILYPAAYSCVIGVGSVDYNNEHCSYSEVNESVNVCAPGGNNVDGQWLWGLNLDSSISGRCGTSFACPQVSAAAAIAKNINPDITHDEFAQLLEITSTDLGDAGYDTTYGYGLLNIEAMTQYLLKDKQVFLSPVTQWQSTRTDMTFYNNTDEATDFFVLWKHDGNSTFEILSADAKSPKEMTFTESYESLSGYIIEKLSLKPLAKNTYD